MDFQLYSCIAVYPRPQFPHLRTVGIGLYEVLGALRLVTVHNCRVISSVEAPPPPAQAWCVLPSSKRQEEGRLTPQAPHFPPEGRRHPSKTAPCPLGISSGRKGSRQFRVGGDPFSRCGMRTPSPMTGERPG